MFARPGPRLVDALEFLVGLLHDKPDLIPEDFPWSWWDAHADANTDSTADVASSAGGSSAACNGDSAASCTPKQNDPVTDAKVSTPGSNPDAQPAQQEARHAQQAEQAKQQPDQPSLPVHQDKQEVQQRKWRAAPYLGPDIEEAHAAAIEAGHTTYVDPATGYKVVSLIVTAFADLDLSLVVTEFAGLGLSLVATAFAGLGLSTWQLLSCCSIPLQASVGLLCGLLMYSTIWQSIHIALPLLLPLLCPRIAVQDM